MKTKSTVLLLLFTISFSFSQISAKLDKNIRSIFQDRNGNYWFGTNSNGVYRYDGKNLIQYTVTDGLSDNQIQSIQEDELGNLWFGTGLFGVSKFDGQTFTTFSHNEMLLLTTETENKPKPNSLWFYAGGGAFFYQDNKLTYLPIGKTETDIKNSQNSSKNLSRFSVYALLKDSKGNIWFGTQAAGVCCYDGNSFTWFTEKGLAGPAVLALFEDKKGNIWMGNNGAGLFCYDGKTLINFSQEKKLDNPNFQLAGEGKPGTLARIYTINEDRNGTLWIGSVDNGVWLYDGKNTTNYTTKDGLTSNAINTIYKDKKDEMWLGTDQNGLCKFNGKTFTKFEVE
jgi:ligand-binding sensor domain-containing protein